MNEREGEVRVFLGILNEIGSDLRLLDQIN